MATVREGSKAALLVVDVQKDVVGERAYRRDEVVANIVGLVERARKAGVPVVWVQHEDEYMPKGGAGWAIVDGLVPAAGEARVEKKHNSAFEGTGLEAVLAGLGASRIVLCGAQSNWCIRATAHGALERGYDLTLASDAHTTESVELKGGRRIEAATIVDELNVSMAWMNYPGRRNESKKAAEISF